MFDAEAQVFAPVGAEPARAPGMGVAESLCLSPTHGFTKHAAEALTFLEGLGVEGDAHCGAFDLHMGRRDADPPPNLRQVHLFPGELADVLKAEGFAMGPGAIGENVTTRGVDLVRLPLDTRLLFPSGAVLRLTGLRTPCRLIDRLGKGLMRRLMGSQGWGVAPIAGVMAVVERGGDVRAGDAFNIDLPQGLWGPLPAL